jgi:glycosyltransferase involved in cell wall biosynthesis
VKEECLSILMPVYNEFPFVKRAIIQVLEVPLPEGIRRELVIVDDASTDGTSDVLRDIADRHPDTIRLFRQDRNQGKGAAIQRAIAEMRGDIAVFQDADLEYDPGDLNDLLEPIRAGRADVVYGSRFAASRQRRVLNYHHAVGNLILTHLSNLFSGLNLTDMETCYKMFRADILRTIPIRSNRFGLEPEITAKIARRGCVVYEVPINYHGRTYAEGKKITWRDGIKAIFVILKFAIMNDSREDCYGHTILNELSYAPRFAAWMAAVIRPWLGNRILEIGSGIGNISRCLPRRTRLTLTDRDEGYLRILEADFRHAVNTDVRKLDLNKDADFTPVAEQYDSVVCLNVLEHIEDDYTAVKRMAGLLDTGGRLIILVPRYPALMSRMDHELGHCRRYTDAMLRECFEAAGLKLETMFAFNFLGLIAWAVSNRLLGRTRFGKGMIKIYDLTVPVMSRAEKYIPLPGLSLIGIAVREK